MGVVSANWSKAFMEGMRYTVTYEDTQSCVVCVYIQGVLKNATPPKIIYI